MKRESTDSVALGSAKSLVELHVNLVRLINCYSPAHYLSFPPPLCLIAAAAASQHDCANLPLQQLLCGKRGTYALRVKAEILLKKDIWAQGWRLYRLRELHTKRATADKMANILPPTSPFPPALPAKWRGNAAGESR